MKKIIIAANSMGIGGTEKALLGMLKSIDYNSYDVTLLLKEIKGDLLGEIPGSVKVRNYPGGNYNKVTLLKEMKIFHLLRYLYYATLMKLTKNTCKKYIYSNNIAPKIKEKYDIAISYYMPISTQAVYVINNINAKNKYAWMHCDVTKMGKEMKAFENIYNKYDKVFCVSKELKKKCIEYFPSLEDKVEVFYNILDKESIIKQASEYKVFKENHDGIRICTVGRLSPEKQQDYIIPIIKEIKKKGYNVKWYCIGEGTLRAKLEEMINENGLQNYVILVGSKTNPYPYIKECDIYVQLSRHEGYCLTLAEAIILNKPIVTTNFAGAREQLENNKTGLIVNNDIHELIDAIIYLIDNPKERINVTNRLIEKNKHIDQTHKKINWEVFSELF